MKRILMIAGPNGAGKTTFARQFLVNEADCPNFINADLIAAGLSPFRPENAAIHAGRVMLDTMKRFVAKGENFAFETTLSGLHHRKLIRNWRSIGYRAELTFLKLPSVQMALTRVRNRVSQGGHPVPAAVIRRRFTSGWRNFEMVYRQLVDHRELYDNSGDEPLNLAEGGIG